jgi:hypothetical protein
MRTVAFVLATLSCTWIAHAQEVAPPAEQTSPIVETTAPPPTPVPEPAPPPAVPEPPVRTIITTPAGRLRVVPSAPQLTRWRRARIVAAFGTFTGLAGLGLSLSSAIYVAVKDYPPSANDVLAPTAKPTDVGPMLAYTGASLSTASFILTASGLGAEHALLRDLGIDTDRARFGAATTLGVFGTVSTGLSYFFGGTGYLNPHDQSVAILTTSITGTALCALASILYLSDSSRIKRNWKTFTQF